MTNSQRLPEKYYQRRRAAAVIVLLIVVALVIWALTSFGRGSESDNDPTPTATATATATSTTTSSETPTTTTEATETTQTTETTAASASCSLEDLVITASSDQLTYSAGDQPTFYMTVANPTRRDCSIDLDEQILRFEVYDLGTNERVWSDVDCFDPIRSDVEVFKAGEERHFEAVWSRTGSAPGKCEDRQVVPAGGYLLHAVIGDNPSEPYTFNLR